MKKKVYSLLLGSESKKLIVKIHLSILFTNTHKKN